MKKLIAAVALLVSVSMHAAPAPQAEPSVTFGRTSLTVTGVTPGASVLFYGLGLEGNGYVATEERFLKVIDDTQHSGSVVYDLGRNIPKKSVWIVADLTNAHFTVTSPHGVVRPIVASRAAVHRGASGAVDTFSFSYAALDAVYFHPGDGAFFVLAHDGGPGDQDGPNGIATIKINQLVPFRGKAHPPSEFHPGGVLVAIDPFHLTAGAMRMTDVLPGVGR